MRLAILFVIFSCILLTSCFFDSEMMAAVQKGSYKMCDKLDVSKSPTRIDDCYAQVAAKKGDKEMCPKIDDARYRSDCFEGVAIKTNDPELCKQVAAEYNSRNCYTQIAINKKDNSICEGVKDLKDTCYLEFAKTTNNVDDCKNVMSDSGNQDLCMLNIAQAKKDEKLCKDVLSVTIKDDCYESVAIATTGNLLCAKIENQGKKDNCYLKTAVAMKDSSACGKISSGKYEYVSCIKQIAASTYNKGLCDSLNEEDKVSCRLQVDNAIALLHANS